ncbi:MAG: gltA, partial [Hyphomicrobiales bacterium]|nr:gltA [Hyphomicrobiales bacterium]
MTEKVAKLVIGDQTYEFPVLSGSIGPDVIDIRSLYAKTGLFTYD